MTQYKHSSIGPIIERIGFVLMELDQKDSKTFLFTQYHKNDTFKGLAKNLCEWRIKFIELNPTLNQDINHHLDTLQEYFEERKVLDIYLGKGSNTHKSFFSLNNFLSAFTADDPGL